MSTTEAEQFITNKDGNALELAINLGSDGPINTSGAPVEEIYSVEANDLIGRGVCVFDMYDRPQCI